MSNGDIEKLTNESTTQKECDPFSLKTHLHLLNLCMDIIHVKKDVTDSALRFLMSKVVNRKPPINICREVVLSEDDPPTANEDKMIFVDNFGDKLGWVENTITSEVNSSVEKLHIDKFVETDEIFGGMCSVGFDDLIKAHKFLKQSD